AVVVLLAVTGGGSIYGIVGAFLAVPVAAVTAVVVRYIGEQIDAAVEVGPDAVAEGATVEADAGSEPKGGTGPKSETVPQAEAVPKAEARPPARTDPAPDEPPSQT